MQTEMTTLMASVVQTNFISKKNDIFIRTTLGLTFLGLQREKLTYKK